MLRISILIFHVLSALPKPLGSEPLPSIFDSDEAYEHRQNLFRYLKKENATQRGLPVAHRYLNRDSTSDDQDEKECLTCLLELCNIRSHAVVDVCQCSPCYIQTSNEEEAERNFIFELFKRGHCGEGDQRKRVQPIQEINKEIGFLRGLGKTRRKYLRNGSATDVRDLKHVEDCLNALQDSSKRVNRPLKLKKITGGQFRGVQKRRPGEPEKYMAEYEGAKTRKSLRGRTDEVVKEKVKTVFDRVLNKMKRMNKAMEEEKVAENPMVMSVANRWLKNQQSEVISQPQSFRRYENQYRKPSFRIDCRQDDTTKNLLRNDENNQWVLGDIKGAKCKGISTKGRTSGKLVTTTVHADEVDLITTTEGPISKVTSEEHENTTSKENDKLRKGELPETIESISTEKTTKNEAESSNPIGETSPKDEEFSTSSTESSTLNFTDGESTADRLEKKNSMTEVIITTEKSTVTSLNDFMELINNGSRSFPPLHESKRIQGFYAKASARAGQQLRQNDVGEGTEKSTESDSITSETIKPDGGTMTTESIELEGSEMGENGSPKRRVSFLS